MITFLSRKHVRYEDNRDVILGVISVASASELPTIDGIDGVRLSEGFGAWDISTGDSYGLIATGTGNWVKQPNGLPFGFYEEV